MEEVVASRDGRPIHRVWQYKRDAFPCPSCGHTTAIVFNIQKQGVYYRCKYCNITQPAPVVRLEDNVELANLLSEDFISVDDAVAVSQRINLPLPNAIRGLRGAEERGKRQKRQLV